MSALPTGSEWTFAKIEAYTDAIAQIASEDYKLDTYPNQIEIISAEQMIDAYSSVGLPVGYKHWSYGKQVVGMSESYKRGQMGLAYEIVINSDPCIAYLMEENTMAMQALVIAHASFGHNCFSDDTELLTQDGWKSREDVNVGDIIATYHRDSKEIEYHPVDEKFEYDYKGEMCHFKNSTSDHLVTPNHNMIYVSSTGKVEECVAGDWTDADTRAITSGIANVPENPLYSDEELRLYAWCITDGRISCVPTNEWDFLLMNPRKIERLRALLDYLEIEYTETPIKSREVKSFSVNLDSKFLKDMPTDFMLSARQYNIFVREWLRTDGIIQTHDTKEDSGRLFTYKNHHVDKLQELAVLSGAKASYECNDDGVYSINIILNVSDIQMSTSPLTGTQDYDGKVWCVSVKNHTLVSRRNGRVLITGNSYFKNNYLFKERTNADGIIDELLFAQTYVRDCEDRYGVDVVEAFLDHCHALQHHGVDHYIRPGRKSKDQRAEDQIAKGAQTQAEVNQLWDALIPKDDEDAVRAATKFPAEPQENLLYFFEKYAPNLETWQREIIRIVRKRSEYFWPQMQCQVGNEGTATYYHYNILQTMADRKLIGPSFMTEILISHTGVVSQQPFNSKHFNGINPYALGFAIMQDIKRMCENPTAEDWEWFPNVCGGDPHVEVQKAAFNHKDETLILQYLSPKVIRDLKLFSVQDHASSKHQTITGIHDEDGYRKVRHTLSKQNDIHTKIPNISIEDVNLQGDRKLFLRHDMYENMRLHTNEAKDTLMHVYKLWGFDVELNSYNSIGIIVDGYTITKDGGDIVTHHNRAKL